jgi:hypothetical protein
VGARADCGGQFSVTLVLLEEEAPSMVQSAHAFVSKPSRYHHHSTKLRTTDAGQWKRSVLVSYPSSKSMITILKTQCQQIHKALSKFAEMLMLGSLSINEHVVIE